MADLAGSGAACGARAACTALVALIVVVLATMLIPGTAGAATRSGRLEIDMSDGAGFTLSPHGALIDTTRLAPGRTTSGTMGIRNGSAGPADLSVQVTDVTDRENGCARAEKLVDPTCGAGAGEIGRDLIYSLATSDTRTGTFSPSWSGSAAQLERGVLISRAIAAGTARWVRMTVALPMSSGNTTQTDTFGFAVRVMLQTSFGVEGIQIGGGGVSTDSPGVTSQSYLGLPFTGVKAAMLIGVGALLVACGLLFVALGGGRRRDNAT
jgi:hypothetical protein